MKNIAEICDKYAKDPMIGPEARLVASYIRTEALAALSHEPVAWEHFDNKGSKELSYHPATEYMTRIGYQSRPLSAFSHVPPEPVSEAVGVDTPAEWELEQRAFAAANSDDLTQSTRDLIKDLWKQYCLAALSHVQAPADPLEIVDGVTLSPREEAQIALCQLSWIEEGGAEHPRRIKIIQDALNRMATLAAPQVDEAMVERGKLLRHFVSMFKSGAQGCEMDWEGAQALALAIEAAIGAKP